MLSEVILRQTNLFIMKNTLKEMVWKAALSIFEAFLSGKLFTLQ